MQNVSDEYKNSMKNTLRERAYIKLSFGLINQEIQAKANIDNNNSTYYSKSDELFKHSEGNISYATLEENFTKVDGNMIFLPRVDKKYDIPFDQRYYNTGLISKNLVYEEKFTLTINFHTKHIDFRGITIDFGESCPFDFDILSNNGQVIRVRKNKMSKFVTDEVFYHTSQITIVFYRMMHLKSRVHIHYILFGYGLFYNNNNVINSKLDSYISPIGENITQIDFTVTLDNRNQYFSIDDTRSAINFFETGQIMSIEYGYQLPNSKNIEWILGNNLLCSEWESDNYTATIRCHDIFRSMEQEYNYGKYNKDGENYYKLAEDVLKIAGIPKTHYYIDDCLQELSSNNPIPRVPCKQALQLIANACRCVLMQSREGKIQIKKNFDQQALAVSDHNFIMTKNDMTSSPKTIKKEEIKEIKVFYYIYQEQIENSEEGQNNTLNKEILIDNQVHVDSDKKLTFYFNYAYYNFNVKVNGSDIPIDNNNIKDQQIDKYSVDGNYCITVLFKDIGEFKLEISGYRYNIVEQYEVIPMKKKGKIIKCENPLISDATTASNVANWLKEYYSNAIEYEYKIRGNPELDVNDVIYQQNDFYNDNKMKVRVCKETLNFNQSFSGHITTRRVEGIKNVEEAED